MSFAHAGGVLDVETAPVILDRKVKRIGIETSGDADVRGGTMADGVGDEFPDDAEEGVCDVVGNAFTRDVEPNLRRCFAEVLCDCQPDGLVEGLGLESPVSQVPDTVPQFGSRSRWF